LARSVPSGPTAAQQDLVGRLAAGITGLSLGEWLVASTPPANPKDGRLDQVLAELEIFEDTEEVNAFTERARRIATEASPDRRALLTDSLVIDASEHIRLRRKREKAEASLREARAALMALESPRARELATKLTAALEAKAASEWEELLQQSNELVEAETRALAAAKPY
jgi:predicted nucleic acid-binding protein